MDNRFLPHNFHLEEPAAFIQLDPHLRQLARLPLIYRSNLIAQLSELNPGIYTISGGRQVGKTTLLKQWMAQLIKDNVNPDSIVYLTGELVEDHQSLIRVITEVLDEMPDDDLNYLIVDEVTDIKVLIQIVHVTFPIASITDTISPFRAPHFQRANNVP